jgi:NTE family protein
MLDALLMDGLSSDLERLTRINQILHDQPAGRLEGEFGSLRSIDAFIMFPSQDVRDIAQRHVHEMPRTVRVLLRGLGALNYGGRQLVSYLLFESGYTRELIQLGYDDAMARREELLAFLKGVPLEGPSGIVGWQDLSEEYSRPSPKTEVDSEAVIS